MVKENMHNARLNITWMVNADTGNTVDYLDISLSVSSTNVEQLENVKRHVQEMLYTVSDNIEAGGILYATD